MIEECSFFEIDDGRDSDPMATVAAVDSDDFYFTGVEM